MQLRAIENPHFSNTNFQMPNRLADLQDDINPINAAVLSQLEIYNYNHTDMTILREVHLRTKMRQRR